MFFHVSQNNSGGSFDFDETAGITHHLVIEADNAEHAAQRMLTIGCYFDGVAEDLDCECCGDRWYAPYDKGDDEPMVYGRKVGTPRSDGEYMPMGWMKEGRETAVHYLDGRIEWYGA